MKDKRKLDGMMDLSSAEHQILKFDIIAHIYVHTVR